MESMQLNTFTHNNSDHQCTKQPRGRRSTNGAPSVRPYSLPCFLWHIIINCYHPLFHWQSLLWLIAKTLLFLVGVWDCLHMRHTVEGRKLGALHNILKLDNFWTREFSGSGSSQPPQTTTKTTDSWRDRWSWLAASNSTDCLVNKKPNRP